MSDMHLGEEDSLLTNIEGGNLDTSKPSEVMVKLVECLKEIIGENKIKEKKPTLILNGDILELALTKTNIAAMTFDRFLELILKKDEPLFDRVVYIPGNHDHHIWELARESQYTDYICRHPNEDLPFPWHKTPLCLPPLPDNYSSNGWGYIRPGETGDVTSDVEDKRIGSEFLDRLIERHSFSKYEGIELDDRIRIEIAYPNLGLFSEDNKKCVLIHHGHFVEVIYRLMSILKAAALGIDRDMPLDVQMLESENFAWIEFFWSTMGRSGDAGEISETCYEHLGNKEHMEKLTSEIANNLSNKYGVISPLAKKIEAAVIKDILNLIHRCLVSDWVKCQEKGSKGENTVRGILLYLNTVWNQILEEQKGNAPSELTFIFGHTHKPFDMCIPLTGILIEGLTTDLNIYNTGGWVVDEAVCNKNKGASIVLLDKELNHVEVHMYKETSCPEMSCVKVTSRKTDGNPFYDTIKSNIENWEKENKENENKEEENKENPWNEFSNIINYEIELRRECIKCRLQGL
nr:metallophosphoesterase [Methanosarcina sp. MTP4]